MYIEPKIESSYYSNNKGKKSGEVYFNPKIGETIYNYIIESKPKVVVEFGVLFGYSTVCIAQALKDINEGGRIYAYDLWENFEYGHGQTIERTKDNLNQYGVESYVRLKYGDLYDWLDNTQFFEKADLLHIDINNDGSILYNIKKRKALFILGRIAFLEAHNWQCIFFKFGVFPYAKFYAQGREVSYNAHI